MKNITTVESLINEYEKTNLTIYLFTALYAINDLAIRDVAGEENVKKARFLVLNLLHSHIHTNKIRLSGLGMWQLGRGSPFHFTAYIRPKRFSSTNRQRVFSATEIKFWANSVKDAIAYAEKWYGIKGIT